MTYIHIDPSKRLKNPIVEYRCKKCKLVILKSGSFNPRWPDYKEVRAVGQWHKDEIAIREVWSLAYPGRPVALQYHMRCKHCGEFNVFTVIIQHFNKDKIKTEYRWRNKIASEFYNTRK